MNVKEVNAKINSISEGYSSPFEGGKHSISITKKHKPLVWENMLGTVYARSPKGKAEYFDYDYDAARKHAQVDNHTDLRNCKYDRNKHGNLGDMDYKHPRHGQTILWGIPKDEK